MSKEALETLRDLLLQLGFKVTELETFQRCEMAFKEVIEELKKLETSSG